MAKKNAAKRKTAAKSAGRKKKPALVRQPNGSALYAGGVPGNAGGSGRPKSEVREAALAGADKAIPKLIAILDDAKATHREVTGAGKVLLQFGLGTQTEVSVEDVKYRWTQTLAEMRKCAEEGLITEDALTRMLSRIRPIWT